MIMYISSIYIYENDGFVFKNMCTNIIYIWHKERIVKCTGSLIKYTHTLVFQKNKTQHYMHSFFYRTSRF